MNGKTKTLAVIDGKAQEFASLVQAGVTAWENAGKLLVEMLDANPNAFTIIRRQCPQISIDVLTSFERIGRKKLYPYLLIDPSPGAQRLLAYPYEKQRELYHAEIPVVVSEGEQSTVQKMPVQNLSASQVRRALGPTGVRTAKEQRSMVQPERIRRVEHSRAHAQRLVSAGVFRFALVKGQPVLQQCDRGGRIGLLRLEILNDGHEWATAPFEVFGPPAEDEYQEEQEKKPRTVEDSANDQIALIEVELKDKRTALDRLPGNSSTKAISKLKVEIGALERRLEQMKILAQP